MDSGLDGVTVRPKRKYKLGGLRNHESVSAVSKRRRAIEMLVHLKVSHS